MSALAICSSGLCGLKTAYWMAVYRRGMPRIISRRFKVASTSCGEVPVLCTPRNVPTASAAYSAAGRPLKPDAPVGQLEIIRKIAAHRGHRLKFVRDHHRAGAQRFRWQYHAMDRASFFELLFPQFFEGMQFERRRSHVHSSVRRGSVTPEREIRR